MKRVLLAAAVVLMLTFGLHGQEVRRALPVRAVAADELAKFLAGVPLHAASPLASLQQSSLYREHVASLARLSKNYDRNYFSKMRAWSASELAPRIPMNLPVYYFFGGPDAVSVLAVFPDAPVYILGGLESVGSIPPPDALTPQALSDALAHVRKSAETILSFGHFITKDMKAELDCSDFRGVLPLIFTFIALTGGEVISARYVGVGSDGILREYGERSSTSRGALPAARIEFRRGGAAGVQTLYYVQANLADDALKSNDAALKWAGRFGSGNVYLKAASYLLHEPYFSRIRSFLLNQAVAVLQDDSGIPLRYFRNPDWRCWFFGVYSGTLDIFSKYYQSDLQAAFFAPGAGLSLPFGTGYKWRAGQSNLLLAVRQQAPRAEPISQGQ
jgi:hypothetical protein